MLTSGSDCSTATYSQGPVPVARASNITFGAGVEIGNDPVFRLLCVKNASDAAGVLYVTFTNVTNTEVGMCTAGEAAVAEGNDTSCADGAAGELGPILRVSVAACGAGGTMRPSSAYTTPVQIDASLAAGETCAISLVDQIDQTATPNQKSAGQTDRFQYDMVFTLQDS